MPSGWASVHPGNIVVRGVHQADDCCDLIWGVDVAQIVGDPYVLRMWGKAAGSGA